MAGRGSHSLPCTDTLPSTGNCPICILIPLPSIRPEQQGSWKPYLDKLTTPSNHTWWDLAYTPVPNWAKEVGNAFKRSQLPCGSLLNGGNQAPGFDCGHAFQCDEWEVWKPCYRERNVQAWKSSRGQQRETWDRLLCSSHRLYPCPWISGDSPLLLKRSPPLGRS